MAQQALEIGTVTYLLRAPMQEHFHSWGTSFLTSVSGGFCLINPVLEGQQNGSIG